MIRIIQIEDAGAIKGLYENELGYPADESTIAKMITQLSGDSHYLVLVYVDEADSKVKGFMQAQRCAELDGGNGWEITTMAVSESKQNQGFGKELIKSLEELARTDDCDFLKVGSRIEREKAHGFYEHLGFECTKIHKRFTKIL